MKTIIAGTRHMPNAYRLICRAVELCGWTVTEVVEGESGDVDKAARRYGEDNGLTVTPFEADWDRFGRAAGPIRNQAMADYGQALIAIWDGKSRGTSDMIGRAGGRGLPLCIVNPQGSVVTQANRPSI